MNGPLDPTKRPRLEPGRIDHALKRLPEIGATVRPLPDGHSLEVDFEGWEGRPRFHFWPYSGWWNRVGGKASTEERRGLGKMVDEANKIRAEARKKVEDAK